MKKLGVLIGRFQVPQMHEGHRFIIHRMLEQCDEVLILFGSANRTRSVKNPFTYRERQQATLQLFPTVLTAPLNDYMYNDSQWMADVAATINQVVENVCVDHQENFEVLLYGHHKDGNDYLNWFPQYEYVNINSDIDISGTEVRNSFMHLLPDNVQADAAYFAKERETFKNYPYPASLNICCGDAVVECLGHILLIKRKFTPGAGNWALPGGHKNTNETFLQCALRELIEETNIRVPEPVLLGSIESTRLFDSPKRSSGIPKLTLAVHMVVKPNPDGSLPRANGSDDAVETRWVPTSDILNKYRLHDDHGDIISEMTGVMPLMAINNPNI